MAPCYPINELITCHTYNIINYIGFYIITTSFKCTLRHENSNFYGFRDILVKKKFMVDFKINNILSHV